MASEVAAAQMTFQPLDAKGEDQADDQVYDGYREPYLDGYLGSGHHLHTLKGELLNGNNRHNGRIFEGIDKLVGQGRQNPFDGLGHDDIVHLLPPGQSQSVRCFPLPFVDGLDSGPNNFGDIGSLKHGNGNHAGKEGR